MVGLVETELLNDSGQLLAAVILLFITVFYFEFSNVRRAKLKELDIQ